MVLTIRVALGNVKLQIFGISDTLDGSVRLYHYKITMKKNHQNSTNYFKESNSVIIILIFGEVRLQYLLLQYVGIISN